MPAYTGPSPGTASDLDLISTRSSDGWPLPPPPASSEPPSAAAERLRSHGAIPFTPGGSVRWLLPGLLLPALLAPRLPAQTAQGHFRDARLPERGEIWLQATPSFESWDHQFGLATPGDTTSGREEPLFADYDGPIADRVFPGRELLAATLNADAPDLGYDSLAPLQVSLGSLDFRELHRNRRRIPLDLEAGLLERLSVAASAPLVKTESEAFFDFDPAGATFGPARSAFPQADAFLNQLQSGREALRARVESGDLSAEREEDARELLALSGRFVDALAGRVERNWLLPLAGTPAGSGLVDRSRELQEGFSSFGISVSTADLSSGLDADALHGVFTGRLGADSLVARERGWTVGEVELGARLQLLDTFRERRARRPPSGPTRPDTLLPVDTAATADTAVRTDTAPDRPAPPGAEAGRLPPDTLRRPVAADATPSATPPEASRDGAGLEVRTAVGLSVRVPTGPADEAPFLTPASFLAMPVGDGQRDVELAAYQDMRYGRFLLRASARRGIQMSDRLTVRVHSPERPFAPESAEVEVDRDLGDYTHARVAPQLVINRALSLGMEYTYWTKEADAYSLVSAPDGSPVETADPLALQSAETRHRLGVGIFYRAASESTPAGARPVEAGFVFQVASRGSGGQTPVSSLASFMLRVPIGAF